MPSIPLPFVISLLLTIVFIRMARRADRSFTSVAFLVLVGLCATQAIVVGLRWNYGVPTAHLMQPILASALPPLAWVCFDGLRSSRHAAFRSVWPHFVAVALVAALAVAWRQPLDLVLATIFIGYGAALLRFARSGSGALSAARIGDTAKAHRALIIVGVWLLASAVIDLAIAVDLGVGEGVHAATIASVANLLTLALAGYAAAIAEGTRPAAETDDGAADDDKRKTQSQQSETAAADADIAAAVDMLMRQRKLYRDQNLTLERLARRAGIPARQISSALNRIHGRNISQIVNEYRVEEAMRLLLDADTAITTIMYEAGFQTKSNFNREFLRVTGMSPSDYRRRGRMTPSVESSEPEERRRERR